ncbi:ABC transporter ATP-binding protein [Paenibacillus sp. HB172176]|uniref:ABC transporter ATP-binding protein n=1 Tax=Paenibacillus sp. HB172176 TaxID=2493690 RepID=UPI0014388679|nr:ABC transporter ATP-binding protein [Paenibacillus sp. HB172176]
MVIQLEAVTWERADKTILKGIDWQVREKEHWCLLGLNGSGKTTLLNMINGYIWPTSGRVSVLGHRFGEYDLRELRKSIGWVSTSLQEKLYGSEAALQIVLSGKYATIGVYDQIDEEDIERAQRMMESLGCKALMDRTYNTLSQGERQRVLIARAMMNNPRLLILDEPCTGLDIFAREQLLGMIQSIALEEDQAPTMIYVTHHVEEVLPCFSRTLLIKEGSVFAAGLTEEILISDRMSRFFDVEVQIERRDGRSWLSVGGR